ncbi:hypothetical protein EJB05_14940, partial [Eragrostis curvula]
MADGGSPTRGILAAGASSSLAAGTGSSILATGTASSIDAESTAPAQDDLAAPAPRCVAGTGSTGLAAGPATSSIAAGSAIDADSTTLAWDAGAHLAAAATRCVAGSASTHRNTKEEGKESQLYSKFHFAFGGRCTSSIHVFSTKRLSCEKTNVPLLINYCRSLEVSSKKKGQHTNNNSGASKRSISGSNQPEPLSIDLPIHMEQHVKGKQRKKAKPTKKKEVPLKAANNPKVPLDSPSMCTRSKRGPASPAMSTRSKRRLII